MARTRRMIARTEYWPSFVDVLTNLLLVFIFLLSIFALIQFLLSREISGRDTVLNRLNAQIAELTEMLALEKAGKGELTDNLTTMQASLAATTSERDRLKGLLDSQSDVANSAGDRVTSLTKDLDAQKEISQQALSQVELLNQQISALRRQIAALETAIGASEDRDKESQTKIADLGRRLNRARPARPGAVALPLRLLRQAPRDPRRPSRHSGGRRPLRLPVRSALRYRFGPDQRRGRRRARQARRRHQGAADGDPQRHSLGAADQRSYRQAADHQLGGRFPSNWELSAARAISVVRYLVDKGIPPDHLVAAGYGEFQPIEEGDSEDAMSKNRRIELKLTEK